MQSPVTVTAAANATDGDIILVNATSAAVTVTTQMASPSNSVVVVKKIDSSANAVTVATEGAEKIDGADTKVLSSQWASVMMVYDGHNWYTV